MIWTLRTISTTLTEFLAHFLALDAVRSSGD
jgi:hypothetical protein